MKLFILTLTALVLIGCGKTNQAPQANYQNSEVEALVNKQDNKNNNENNNEGVLTSGVLTNKANKDTNSKDTNSKDTNNKDTNNKDTNKDTDSKDANNKDTNKDTSQTNNTASTQKATVAQQTYEKITKGIDVETVDMSVEQVRDLYQLDPTVLKSCVVRTTTDGATPTEIAIFELDTQTNNDAVIMSIEDRIDALNEQWSNPNVQMATKDNVIVLIISPQAEQMIQNFSQA